ncbi:MAG: CBS domain-containing protein [Propionibacteriaceae bacterium]|nr:CBS domain-containing protein [Propionibacteriaceae bacterium]
MKTARDLMTTPAECLAPDETLVTAARMLSKYDVGSMPVVDGDTLVGVVTDRDIVINAVAKGLDPQETPVTQIATSNVVTVEASANATEVAALMAEHQVRRLPVVDGGKVVGMVAQADVARDLDEGTTGEVVEEISQS